MERPDKYGCVVVGHKYHPQSQSSLVLAHVPGELVTSAQGAAKRTSITNGYVVAWVPQGQRYIDDYTPFESYHFAHAYFMAMKEGGPPPTVPFTRDSQKQSVYRWQWDNIKGYHNKISLEDAEKLVRSISEEFNLRAPGLDIRNNHTKKFIFFQQEKHTISGHPSMLTIGNIVHECAHLVETHANKNIYQLHGPTFVRTLAYLAGRYIEGNNEKELLQSAGYLGLLGLPPEIHYLEPPQSPVILKPSTPKGP